MIVKTKGIIISDTNYSETSKILNVLTEDYGKIGVIAKGARTMKSHLLGVSQKLSYGEFTINYKENGLSILKEVNIINSLKNILLNVTNASFSFYIVDLINQVLRDNNDNKIFYLLESSLLKINDGLDPSLITNIVELQLLNYLGVSLTLNECVLCGRNDCIKTIDINKGGLICDKCYHDGYIFSLKTIKLIRMMYYVDLKKLDNISINDEFLIKELNDFVREYYSQYTGIYLKKKDNIYKLLGIKKALN